MQAEADPSPRARPPRAPSSRPPRAASSRHGQPATAAPDAPGQLDAILHRRGQRATPQRNVILRELRRRERHATAEEIGLGVRQALPGTSTPTVYATLELLVELGLARRIDTGLGAALYDARTEPHQHLVCRCCGTVEDLDGQLEVAALVEAAGVMGFEAEAAELVISGVCASCAAGRR